MVKGTQFSTALKLDTVVNKTKTQQQEIRNQTKFQINYDTLLSGHKNNGVYWVGYSFIKRLIDLVGACLFLLIFLPLILIIALLIKLDSSGPVLFRQLRIGHDRRRNSNNNGHLYERRNGNLKGKPIWIYKFRTMKNGVDNYAISPENNYDHRLTRVGRIIRPLCLDELPQLINVLKGEMTLVGPRPEMPFIVQNYSPLEALRLVVKPGITGVWQLNAPRTQFIHENLHYDLDYIKNRSSMLDFKIMVKTLRFMLNFKNI